MRVTENLLREMVVFLNEKLDLPEDSLRIKTHEQWARIEQKTYWSDTGEFKSWDRFLTDNFVEKRELYWALYHLNNFSAQIGDGRIKVKEI